MSLDKKEILHHIAEDIAYSSKEHYKTVDWINISTAFYIFIPLVTSLLMLCFMFSNSLGRIISFIGFFFSLLALNSILSRNRDKANQIIKKHMELGNDYLEVYKEIRNLDCKKVNSADLEEFQKRVSVLDKRTNLLKISFIGRWWAKFRIKKEMNLDWIYKKSK